MQWTWIEEKEEIGHTTYVGSGAIWPKIVGKDTREGCGNATGVGKRKWRTVSSRLVSNNVYSVLCPEKLGNKSNSINTTERVRDVRHILWPLREV